MVIVHVETRNQLKETIKQIAHKIDRVIIDDMMTIVYDVETKVYTGTRCTPRDDGAFIMDFAMHPNGLVKYYKKDAGPYKIEIYYRNEHEKGNPHFG